MLEDEHYEIHIITKLLFIARLSQFKAQVSMWDSTECYISGNLPFPQP